MSKPADRESDEQSIKTRKNQLFEAQAAEAEVGDDKPFSAYVKATPPAPLPASTKAALAVLGVLITLLFLATLMAEAPPKPAAIDRPPRTLPTPTPGPAPAAPGVTPAPR